MSKDSTDMNRRGRRRYVLVCCVGAALFLALAGAALGGAFSDDQVGTEIAGGPPSGPPDFRQAADEIVVATGSLPVAGRWRLTAYESAGTVHGGVEVEPAGLPCVRLMLAAPPPGTPFAGRGFCGDRGSGAFDVTSLAVRDDASGAAEIVLFGSAPESATAVRLAAPRGAIAAANTQEGHDGFAGDVWVMAVDPEMAAAAAVEWVGRDGKPGPVRLSAAKDARGQLDALK